MSNPIDPKTKAPTLTEKLALANEALIASKNQLLATASTLESTELMLNLRVEQVNELEGNITSLEQSNESRKTQIATLQAEIDMRNDRQREIKKGFIKNAIDVGTNALVPTKRIIANSFESVEVISDITVSELRYWKGRHKQHIKNKEASNIVEDKVDWEELQAELNIRRNELKKFL